MRSSDGYLWSTNCWESSTSTSSLQGFCCCFGTTFVSLRLHFALSKDSEAFLYLTNHEIFSKYINEIICNEIVLPERYLEQPDWDTWWAASQKYRVLLRTEGDCSINSHDQYISYQMLHAEQERVKDERTDTTALCSSLDKLPNLQSVTITDGAWYWRRGYLTPHLPACRIRDLPMHGYWPAAAPQGDVWDQRSSPHHGFVNMIRTLSISGTTISQLRINGGCCGISHRLFLPAQLEDHHHLCTVFSHLQKLDLHINTHYREDLWQEACGSGKIENVFAAAKSLEHLRLTFDLGGGLDEYEYYSLLNLATCFGNVTLDHLRALELVSCTVDHVSLAEFLARQNAFEDLTLTFLANAAEDYALFLDELRLRAVVLKHCMFYVDNRTFMSWSSKEPKSEELVEYLRYGGKNPRQKDEAEDEDEDESEDESSDDTLTSLA